MDYDVIVQPTKTYAMVEIEERTIGRLEEIKKDIGKKFGCAVIEIRRKEVQPERMKVYKEDSELIFTSQECYLKVEICTKFNFWHLRTVSQNFPTNVYSL
ncbi:MAG: hypothetical protein QMD14_00720 [Candidatus Aenigmarchaeota archaeon]|nr:hypothetical protein [Candidatus Aenigmarchaeota archaeon]